MEKIRLGRTGLTVGRSGFGAIPIQRIDFDAAKAILRHAYENGVTLFDTARGYTDSEEKIGYALSDVRKDIIIATKTPAKTEQGFFENLETSLRNLKTDYIDIYQLHNPEFVPGEEHELYQAALKAKKQGKIRFISITNHRLDYAMEQVRSGLYDTMQFPLSVLSSDADLELVKLCKEMDVGFIAMKAMSGGLISNPTATFSFLRGLENVVPIWGIQHMWELEQFLSLEENPPEMDDQMLESIERDRKELSGNFCRGCGYCMPTCPAKINIGISARISLLLRRAVAANWTTQKRREEMEKINDCTDCGECRKHCPYGLDTPKLLRSEYEFYQKFLADNNS